MSTLGGLFDRKPQSHRNFLLENKRDVKEKSSSNSLKQKATSAFTQKQNVFQWKSHTHATSVEGSTSRLKHKGPSGSRYNPQSASLSKNEPLAQSNIVPPKEVPKGELSTRPQKLVSSARTVHYIDQENVPFEWTEVCPSLISHKICHQGVQTEDNKCAVLPRSQHFEVVNDMQSEKDRNHSNRDTGQKVKNGIHNGNPTHNQALLYEDTAESKNKGIGRDECDKVAELVSNFDSFHCTEYKGNRLEKQRVEETSDSVNPKISTSRKFALSTKAHGDHESYPSSYQKGAIPKYLSRRKAEQALASARAKEIDPNCPEGHVAMPDDERRETLDTILKNYNDLITELNRIPVRTDTLKMKQRKIEVEKQLDKLEEGIRIFSRSKVYVKLDA